MSATIILNCAYVALVSASFARSLFWLRGVLVVASLFLITFGILEDITSMVLWNIAIGASHAFRLGKDLLERRRSRLDDQSRWIGEQAFPGLVEHELFALWSAGVDHLGRDMQLTTQGVPNDTVSLVIDGRVDVARDQVHQATLGPGMLVGEMGFARDEPASADAVAVGAVWLRSWNADVLSALDKTHPQASRAFHRRVEQDMADKLDNGASARHR